MPDFIEDYESEIVSAIREAADQMGNEDAAQSWSYVSDGEAVALLEKYGPGEVLSIASFGDAVGVNGDLVIDGSGEQMRGYSGVDPYHIPAGFEDTERGGKVYSTETELSAQHVHDRALQNLKADGLSNAAGALSVAIIIFMKQEFDIKGGDSPFMWGSDDGSAETHYKPESEGWEVLIKSAGFLSRDERIDLQELVNEQKGGSIGDERSEFGGGYTRFAFPDKARAKAFAVGARKMRFGVLNIGPKSADISPK